MSKILIVEDEESIADIEKDYLELNGYEVEVCNDGTSGLAAALHEDIDMCILDIMLPGTDGFEICKQVREVKDIPIIMVSAKKEDIDKIRGLGIGADDYITKPFSVNELLARISAHLRREQRSHNKTKSKFSEDLIIDYSDRSLYIKGHKIELSNKEFEIIQLLSSNAGQVFDREKIYENIWGIDGNGDSVVIKEHIRKIRLKFNEFTDKGYITTVWGVGYKWEK